MASNAAATFPVPTFVGMISDEIGQFRAAGKFDADVAAVIQSTVGRDISAQTIAQVYAPPEERRGGGHG